MPSTGLVNARALPPTPGPARRALQSLLESNHWPGDVDSVVLAVHEALMNSVRHAGGPTSAAAVMEGPVLVVEVRDRGPGFDVDDQLRHPPDPMAERGRGLWLISQIAESWEVLHGEGQTTLRLRFRP